MTLACKRTNMTKSYINRFGVHWRIRGRWNWGVAFCGGTNNAKGHKGGGHCCEGKIIIHKSEIESIISHIGVDNGKITTKGDGDWITWSGSNSKEKMYNLGHIYTFGKMY